MSMKDQSGTCSHTAIRAHVVHAPIPKEYPAVVIHDADEISLIVGDELCGEVAYLRALCGENGLEIFESAFELLLENGSASCPP